MTMSFFLTYIADLGRDMESTRGFLELLSPVLATEAHDSALFTAINAIASQLWLLLTHRDTSSPLTTKLLTIALARLQKAVEDPGERERDATVLAALVLQLNETLSAMFGQYRAQGTHRNGALALLLQRADVGGSKYYGTLVGNLLHAKVSVCIRERQPFPPDQFDWFRSKGMHGVPINPSSLLDIIGVSVANLQCLFYNSGESLSPAGLAECSAQMTTLDAALHSWLQVVPGHWYPKRLQSGRDIDSSIHTYQGACDVYPSAQTATIWNVWRTYCLILIRIKLQLTNAIADGVESSIELKQKALELVDGICYSVPFYLGNRVAPMTLHDVADTQLVFPSYHDLPFTDECFMRYRASSSYISKINHSRHMTLQGPLNIMSILASLIKPSTDTHSLLSASTSHQTQNSWILEQFQRSLYILHLVPDSPISSLNCHKGVGGLEQKVVQILEAEMMANKIQQEPWTMTLT
jgi:hypothetical protein